MCRSAQNASSHAMLANANEIKADFTFRRDWGIRTQFEELERRRSGTQRFVKDLTYIGTAEDGVEKFKLVSTNATVVYNTIFTRSERMEGHVKKFIRGIEEKKAGAAEQRLHVAGYCPRKGTRCTSTFSIRTRH